MPSMYLTEDGHDVQLQANHLGHFLLVHELLPLLLAAGAEEGRGPARVVSHSSNAHWMGWPSFSAADAGIFDAALARSRQLQHGLQTAAAQGSEQKAASRRHLPMAASSQGQQGKGKPTHESQK